MPSRLAAFRQPNEEAHKIADILVWFFRENFFYF